MPITIGTNTQSLVAQRRLSESTAEISRTFERLSSGLRINRASDDAASLSIADSLSSNSRVFTQGIRNFNDGASLLNIADSAVEQLSTIIVRLKELAEQSANGTYGPSQRNALDTEAQALSKEFFRISRSTNFNGRNIFDGTMTDGLRLQGGYGTDGSIFSMLGGSLGTGTFGSVVTFGTSGTSSRDVQLADVNGDGIIDMVSAGGNGATTQITVQFGLGDGTFAQGATYSMPGTAQPFHLELNDVNNDGILDAILAGNSGIGVRFGSGDGTFGALTSYNSGRSQNSLALGDLNGDGFVDMLSTSGNTYSVRLGRGDGTFGSETSTQIASHDGFVASQLADVNGDGVLDMIAAGEDSLQALLTIRYGDGSGGFSSSGQSFSLGLNPFGVPFALGDLNNDGALDIVSAKYNGLNAYEIQTYTNNGSGTFSAGSTYTMASSGGGLADLQLRDLNGDGNLDIVSVRSTQAVIRLGAGNGTFGGITSFTLTSGLGVELGIADLNRDGVLDFLAVGTSGGAGRASVAIARTQEGIQPLLQFSLKTAADAKQALSLFETKQNLLTSQRGVLGAFQSRLVSGINVLDASKENFKVAESRIRDADIAHEAAQSVRLSILQKAATAVLTQANQQPEIAIQLLQ